jgi:hypothetical protein
MSARLSCDIGGTRIAQVDGAPAPEDAMNIMLWYLPFAMFTETCDLVIAECKAPTPGKPNAERTRRPALHATPRQR